jgi:hypothetical protein
LSAGIGLEPVRVKADPDHLFGGKGGVFASLVPCAPEGSLQAQKVIAGMLAGYVVIARVEQDAVPAAEITHDRASKLAPVGYVCNDHPHRVAPVVSIPRVNGIEHRTLVVAVLM